MQEPDMGVRAENFMYGFHFRIFEYVCHFLSGRAD